MIEEMRLYSSVVKAHRRGRPSFLGKGFKGQRIMVMARTRLLGGGEIMRQPCRQAGEHLQTQNSDVFLAQDFLIRSDLSFS